MKSDHDEHETVRLGKKELSLEELAAKCGPEARILPPKMVFFMGENYSTLTFW